MFISEETFLNGNHLASGEEENNHDHSFASLTRQIQNQFRLFDNNKKDNNKSDKNNLFAYLNCKHASI